MSFLQHIKDDERAIAKLESKSERSQAHGCALNYEDYLAEKYADDPDFTTWNPNRALDLQDFDYLLIHRNRFSETVSTQLEFIAAKITHIKKDGDDGYFNKLERNVGWTKHITPLVRCQVDYVDKLVRCGIWSRASNSGRCHKPDCPCCHWNDILKVQVEAFGSESLTFDRMQQQGLTPSFITLGYTTNPANSKCVGRDFEDKDISYSGGDPEYDPYPVRLGLSDDDADLPCFGYEDAKLLGIIAQQAMERVYKNHLLAGYHFKVEGAFKLVPGGANRVNLHAHVFANGHEDDPQVLANGLMKEMRRGFRRYKKYLNREYHPDVLVLRLNSAEHIERVVRYFEKILPIGLIVEEAMGRPEAKSADGFWNPEYVEEVKLALMRLVNEDIPTIFSGSSDRLFQCLRRRKSVGNMRFNDRGTCLGDEPFWHKKLRRKRAKLQREKRLQKKKQKDQMEAESRRVRRRTPHRRRTSARRRSKTTPGQAIDADGSQRKPWPRSYPGARSG